jgi:hypothetical protein
MDWYNDFKSKFGSYAELQGIKQDKLHGSLTINFCAGVPLNYNLTIHRRAETKNPNERTE